MAIPVLLFLLSFLQNTSFESKKTSISEFPDYLEVPDYMYSAEYRMIMEKTFLETFDMEITDSMRLKMPAWLGYCNESTISGECKPGPITTERCGDKIRYSYKR